MGMVFVMVVMYFLMTQQKLLRWCGDGYGDNGDVFPNDSSEWFDTDGDGGV